MLLTGAKWMLIDTHCHLNSPRFADDLPETIARAQQAGVTQMIVVGYDVPSSEEAVELAERHAPIFAAVAVHPHDSKDYSTAAQARLRELAAHPKVVAIGEIGLDFHYDFSPVESQFAAFRAQLALAREASLPVIIHCREAYRNTLDVLAEEDAQAVGGVMHCWAGSAAEAERALRMGLFLGIGGILTFKNAAELREIALSAPMDRLLVETDAPYLAPAPHRGKRNEPAYTRLVAQQLACVRAVALEEIAARTTENALRLFKRLKL
jgi:TatD DNase family protein